MTKPIDRIVLIHGTHVVIPVMEELIRGIDMHYEILHMLDEPLLAQLVEVGEITPQIRWRFTQLVVEAATAKPKLILVTGSSFSPCVDFARAMVSVPVIKVDEKMAEEAVLAGERLAIVATEHTTIEPTIMLLKQKAKENGQNLEIRTIYCEGAHGFLRNGQPERHDSIVLEQISSENLEDLDAIVLAQVSTARVMPQLEKLTSKKTFSSPGTVGSVLRELMTKP